MAVDKLVELVRILRSPTGCPWDREQTHQSLKPMMIEEVSELLDAIDANDTENVKEELGDILLHIVFHSILAEEENKFQFTDVVNEIVDKIRRRHPHVFKNNGSVKDSDKVIELWQEIKAEERKKANKKESTLGRIPRNLPALLRAEIIQKKVAKVGFDWSCLNDVMLKIEEEVGELKSAIAKDDQPNIDEEIGDLLFAIVNYCRYREGSSAEELLQKANNKFSKRFNDMEKEVSSLEKKFEDLSSDELDELWKLSKKRTHII